MEDTTAELTFDAARKLLSAPLRIHGLPLVERIAPRSPRTALFVVNETGHYVMREQPEAFHRAVRSFTLG